MAFRSEHPFVVSTTYDPVAVRAAEVINNDLFYSRSLPVKEQLVLAHHLIDRWNARQKVGHLLAITLPNPTEKSQ